MTNIEYIHVFADKHKFPKTECEVIFNAVDDGSGRDIHTTDYDIISVKFDKSLVKNEIKIEDIRFDVDSKFPDDVFFIWQEDDPEIPFKLWISQGRYVPNIIKNTEYLDKLERLTKDIEMKLESMFPTIDDGDSDYDEDSDYEYDDEEYDGDGEE